MGNTFQSSLSDLLRRFDDGGDGLFPDFDTKKTNEKIVWADKRK